MSISRILACAVVVAIFTTGCGSGENPTTTPTPSCPEEVPLDEPIPCPLPWQMGDRTVMLPVGSTLEDVHSDPGGRFITIRRGESSVVFDGDTGEVLEWDVAREDTDDFESLRAP